MSHEEIKDRFGTHTPSEENAEKHKELRFQFMNIASELDVFLPSGRAKDLAMTALEEASMWAHKAVASLDPVDEL
jgi:phenylalanyl-tRNA synthetase beta subunit